ncbi:Uncharacterised protein [Klebsiella quasipneumoniae]|nr:Uncharacterised protein [Klebsiella quasipneumoniae]
MHGQLSNQLRDMLRGKELTAGLTRIGGIIGYQKLIGITEQVNLMGIKIPESQPLNPFQYRSKPDIFLFNGTAQPVTGRIKISKQSLNGGF